MAAAIDRVVEMVESARELRTSDLIDLITGVGSILKGREGAILSESYVSVEVPDEHSGVVGMYIQRRPGPIKTVKINLMFNRKHIGEGGD